MRTYDLDVRGHQSKYEYLYLCIREDIRSGVIPQGEKLPSKRAAAKHLSVSVSTVEQAYDLLVSEGYAKAVPGSGFFALEHKERMSQALTQTSATAAVAPAPAAASIAPSATGSTEAQATPALTPIDFKANRCSMNLFPVDTWSRLMRRTLSERAPELFETVPYNGLLGLRRAIAHYLFDFKGMVVRPEQIVVGAGTEYLYSRLMQLLGPVPTIAIGDTGSKKFVDLTRGMGTNWNFVPVDQDGMRVDKLSHLHADAVHVSPANHFPTGVILSPKRREELLSWADSSLKRFIIEDDYDSELRYQGRALPPLFVEDAHDRVIYLNTFSKILVPSIRISFMVLPPQLAHIYQSQLSFYSCTVSSFEQYALALFIEEGYLERHINRLRRYYDKQRSLVSSALAASPLMKIATMRPVNVGTHLICSLKTRLTDTEVKEAAEARGMNLSMLSDYCYLPSVLSAHEMVINFASIAPEMLDEVVARLCDIFAEDIADPGPAPAPHK
ncbi:MAG: PLP-dependent aminotransferase family protein [Atopobiaceae bacterium]|jgi:GntR family transcriptional regulator/MocR family aminotransferase